MNALACDTRPPPRPRKVRFAARIKRERKLAPGVASLEFALRFADWATAQQRGVTADGVQEHWHVCRATAYRWCVAWRAAKGLP